MADVELPLFPELLVPSVETLPEPFVMSLRALWDILDDGKYGLVSLVDIERHWRQDGASLRGVLESVRLVCPADNMLSFEVFCKGLQMALSGQQSPLAKTSHQTDIVTTGPVACPRQRTQQPARRANVTPSTSALFAPGLPGRHNPPSPRRPPRASRSVPDLSTRSEPASQAGQARVNKAKTKSDKGRIMDKLRLWQNETQALLHGDVDSRGSADGTSNSSTDNTGPSLSPPAHSPIHKGKEFRRHTLSNGLDYNMLKHMKQLEQEKDVLLQGLETVERARDWYHSRILAIQDKQKYLDAESPSSKRLLDTSQVLINNLAARVQEVNCHLNSLMQDSEDKDLSLHMDLLTSHSDRKVHSPAPNTWDSRGHIQALNDKAEIIQKLEQEKSLLIRQVFEARAQIQKMQNPSNDTTFI